MHTQKTITWRDIIRAATQPLRLKIIKLLAEHESLYLTQIVNLIGNKSRRDIYYHLKILSTHGLVECEHVLKEGPAPTVIARYRLTKMAREILERTGLDEIDTS